MLGGLEEWAGTDDGCRRRLIGAALLGSAQHQFRDQWLRRSLRVDVNTRLIYAPPPTALS
jgi:hypothetical protein